MSVTKKTCRICAKEDLHANFVNIFELTVPNVDGDAGDDKISLFEAMRQLTGIKVIGDFVLYCACEPIKGNPRENERIETFVFFCCGMRLTCFETKKKFN